MVQLVGRHLLYVRTVEYDEYGNKCNIFKGNCGGLSVGTRNFLIVFSFFVFILLIWAFWRKRRQKQLALRYASVNSEMNTALANPPVVITSATHQTTNAGYPPQNIGVHTAPYPTGTQSGFQPFPMPQPTINTGFQPMPQPGAGYTPYPPNNNSAPYPPAVPTIQNTDAMNPPSYDQVVNAEPYQKQDAYNPNFKSQ